MGYGMPAGRARRTRDRRAVTPGLRHHVAHRGAGTMVSSLAKGGAA